MNSIMAAAIATVKISIKVAHLEAGLRSFDRSMPEAIIRILLWDGHTADRVVALVKTQCG